MTNTNDIPVSGEARLKARRRRLWSFCAIGFAVAMATGFATGVAGDLYAEGTLPAWSLYALWGLALAGCSWFTIGYFRRVDELDLMDNLWATMVGFYFYALAMPSWYLFHDLGLAAAPNQYIIYISTMAVTLAAYGLRKLGLR